MSKVPNESKIPVRGKVQPTTKSFSRLASNISNKVRAHLTTESSKLRPASGTLLGFLSPGSRSKGSKRSLQRPSAFYQPLVSDWKPKTSMSENCSPIRETIDKNQIGRKVYVQGSKTGTLRYYGKTVIGEGNWCGVELDRPEGKNDGSVNNSRYFTCAPLHGLFLLETKVTLIPSVEPRPNSFLMTTGSADISPEEKASTSNSRPSSQISTPGSTGLPHFDLTLSSSVGSLIPKAQLPDRSLQSKHSSFEFDESLGILTPDQMSDFTLNCTLADQLPRTPSVDELSSFMLQDVTIDPVSETYLDVDETKLEPSISMETTECPTQERFSKEVSQEASESHSKKTSDISSSLRISKKEGFDFRQDRTPSLEDLPLDLSEDMKQDVTRKSVPPPNSFITSITSITSLDNGYQGDGEWSRPASRGPEHSPSAHQKVIKPKLDPMTDSDFFTESDADMHEECAGHRRAQVIDGTLYGGSGQPGSSSIGGNQIQRFSPTNEEMDSSGIFSDLEKKSEEPIWEKTNVIEDERNASPEGSIMTTSSKSDQSLKKISPTNFTLINERLDSIKNFLMNAEESDILPEIDEGVSEAKKARCSEPKQNNDPTPNKKFKMPKRNVVSKIKTMMTPPPVKTQEDTQENRNVRTPKKGRWDAVMNKIAQGQAQEKTTPKLKEVKSKVYCGITTQPNKALPARPSTTPGACRKAASTRCLSTAQSISTRSLRDITTIKNKRYESRRNRIRSSESSLQGPVPGSQASSRNSSISDLSQPKPSTPRSSKKREARCCSSPQSDGSTNSSASHALKNARANQDQNLKNSTSPGKNAVGAEKVALNRKITPRRLNFPSKPQTLRDHNRVNSNGGKAENGFTFKNSPPTQGQTLPAAKIQRQPDPNALAAINHASKGAEALAILVNYLVHHVDAFSAPKLKKDLDNSNKELLKTKQDLDELHLMYNDLREEFNLEKKTHEEAFEEAYRGYEDEKNELSGKFKEEYNKLSQFHQEKLNEIREDFEAKEKFLKEKYEQEVDLLQKSHVENVENLKKRNAAETERIKKECSKAIAESNNREEKLKKKIEDLQTEFDHLKQKSDLFLSSAGKDAKLKVSIQQSNELQQEIDSLRSVLDLKSTELLELRRQSQMWRRDSEQLPATQYKVATLQAKVEDLQAQLEQKEAYEHQLEQEIGNLSMRVEKEATQQKRLSMHNEELMWKLKKNYEVVNAMAALSGASPIAAQKESNFPYSLSKTASEADIDLKRSFFGNETTSPPGSPKVKAIIEKNESVAWMLDMYDEPQCIASKILQRAQSVKTSSPPTPQTRGTKQRNRSSKSLTLTPSPLKMKSKSSPCTPEMRNSPEGDSWDEEHVTEEVIIVKSMGDRSVLELFDVDNSEIHIEDHPKKELSDEDIEMLRRVEQPGSRGEIILPKESAGEAMISGEASDDEEARDEDDLDSIQISTSDDDFSDHEIDSSLNDPDAKKEEFSNSLLKELENMY